MSESAQLYGSFSVLKEGFDNDDMMLFAPLHLMVDIHTNERCVTNNCAYNYLFKIQIISPSGIVKVGSFH